MVPLGGWSVNNGVIFDEVQSYWEDQFEALIKRIENHFGTNPGDGSSICYIIFNLKNPVMDAPKDYEDTATKKEITILKK